MLKFLFVLQGVFLIYLIFFILIFYIYNSDNEKIKNKLDKFFLFFDLKKRKKLKKEKIIRDIYKNGTTEEIIKIHNKINPYYQYFTDVELKEKYNGLNFSKVQIVETPAFLFDHKTNKIIKDNNIYFNNNNNIKNYSVESYELKTEYDKKNMIKKLNTYKTIIIFRHKTNNYRFKIIN